MCRKMEENSTNKGRDTQQSLAWFLLVATYLLHRKHQITLFSFEMMLISISVFPFSVFPFSVFPLSVFPFSGDKYFHSQVTSTKSCERGSSPAPPSPGEEEAITITNSHTRCFSAFKLFYHLFGQIFVKICVKLIITHPTNLHTR